MAKKIHVSFISAYQFEYDYRVSIYEDGKRDEYRATYRDPRANEERPHSSWAPYAGQWRRHPYNIPDDELVALNSFVRSVDPDWTDKPAHNFVSVAA